jgi:pimeloyl-ACP methyl ester carboxylesterase
MTNVKRRISRLAGVVLCLHISVCATVAPAQTTQVPAIEHVKLANGLDMAYRRSGRGPVSVVLVHGYSLSSAEWVKVLPLLPEDRYTAYAVDLRGFGDSGKPEDGNEFKQLIADLAAFMDAKGLPRAVMIGHSMGGALLQDFVLAHPERVSALVLSDAFARNEPPIGISESVRKRIDGYGGADNNRRVFEAAMPHYFDAGNVSSRQLRSEQAGHGIDQRHVWGPLDRGHPTLRSHAHVGAGRDLDSDGATLPGECDCRALAQTPRILSQ